MKRPPAALPPAVQPVEPTLVWQRPDGSTVDILVPLARTVTIGRRETNSVVVESAWVSKTHASVRFADGHYIVEDLQSSNGTRVNDAPIASSVLTPGDVIHIGDQTFTFVDRAAARGARRRTGQQPRGAAGKLIRLGAVAALIRWDHGRGAAEPATVGADDGQSCPAGIGGGPGRPGSRRSAGVTSNR